MNFFQKIFNLYYEGFRNMQLGKTLWKIIILKLIVLYGVLKLFVFDENFKTLYPHKEQRSEFVLKNLTKEANGSIKR
ncbi:DUF4492 domain-containing protein [Helicobacter brantae]|uniref:DUF4492 domain-containing protein n=1 Tax=Helicobacter brantae TaxID=375927 RepID=A0A3D8J3K7_9HELI|nr:DUF4492 domain-containing protein [Helicobacter brantae]RDU72107.1 DUF4492 domain-containing protein [Helicobacter brantae]